MDRSTLGFLDLPNEIFFIILKKLDTMDVLYSLLDADNQRLDMIVQNKTFTQTLNFVLTTADDDIISIAVPILDRFCINILPKIDRNVKSLIVESGCIERILLAADYPNLTELKIFNFNDEIVSDYFTDGSSFRRVFRQQITDLIVVYRSDIEISVEKQYLRGVHEYILKFFENLKHLSITGSPTVLTLRNSPLTTFSSSTLHKLCIHVNRFEDCLGLLDGRLKQLTVFTVLMNSADIHPSVIYNMDDLPDLKYFSLSCTCVNNEYDTQVLPLLRRMSNLEELTLNIKIEDRTKFIDGTQINNEILVHMSRVQKFNFHITTEIILDHAVQDFSIEDIQRTFTNKRYQNVGCILNIIGTAATCHVFSVPFVFDSLGFIGNTFPPIVFTCVTNLAVHDVVPFKHEFFVRIARFFPLLKKLTLMNSNFQQQISDKSDSEDNQLNSVVEYPHLVSLCLEYGHIDYVEQFFNETKTHLPRLTKLTVHYDRLAIATENFTRETTRLNCSKVKQLGINKIVVHSTDFYAYFPQLSSCSRCDWFYA